MVKVSKNTDSSKASPETKPSAYNLPWDDFDSTWNCNVDGKGRQIESTYNYEDEGGNFLFQVVRHRPKGFCQRRVSGGKWVYSLNNVRRVPYRLPELLAADPQAPVF